MDKHVAIIWNIKSGNGKAKWVLPQLESALHEQQITFTVFADTLPTTLAGFTDLIVLGGDGTLNFVINWFKQISIPIALIACGTGNDFANCLYGDANVEEQINLALFGKAKPVDAGICNNQLFINGVGVGFDGEVAHNLYAKSFLKGKLAYMATVLPLLFVYKETEVKISMENFNYQGPLFMLSAANGTRYGGGFYVAPKANITDKKLNFMLATKANILKRLIYLPYIEKGKHALKAPSFIQQHTFLELTIEANQLLRAHLDGEVTSAKQFTIKILPHYFEFKMQ